MYIDNTFYEVSFLDAGFEQSDLGVLVDRNADSSRQTKDGRHVVKADGTEYKFDECTSPEAIHLTAHSLNNAKDKLVWHDYFYLGYDVEPTCGDNTSGAIDSLTKSFNSNAQKRAR
jgi:hypothetical protein